MFVWMYGDMGLLLLIRRPGPFEGEAVAEEGVEASYAFLKVLRTVGEAPAAPASGKERPVVELPNVRGRAVVWRVSLGREAIDRSPERQEDIVDDGPGRISEVERRDIEHSRARLGRI